MLFFCNFVTFHKRKYLRSYVIESYKRLQKGYKQSTKEDFLGFVTSFRKPHFCNFSVNGFVIHPNSLSNKFIRFRLQSYKIFQIITLSAEEKEEFR